MFEFSIEVEMIFHEMCFYSSFQSWNINSDLEAGSHAITLSFPTQRILLSTRQWYSISTSTNEKLHLP